MGSTLVITGNPAITQINNQIAPEFNASTSYKTGDLVMYNGVVYMFTQNHTGAWNSNHVVSTNLSAQIELLPDKIIQYVGEKGYSRTFVQLTDPALDPENMVVPGDYWIKSNNLATVWENPDNTTTTWGDFKNDSWGEMLTSMADMYCRKGTGANAEWVPVNDTNFVSEAYTRIEQTRDRITQEAYRANAAEGELSTKIDQTAHDIKLSAEQSYLAKSGNYDTVNAIIDEAISLANNAATSAKNASIAKTEYYQDAQSIVTAAVAESKEQGDNSYIAQTTTIQTADQIITQAKKESAVNVAPEFSTSTAYAIGDVVSYQGDLYIFTSAHPKGAWNSSHVIKTNLNSVSAGKYIAQTSTYQTAEAIVTEAVAQAKSQGDSSYIAKTNTYQTADAIVSTAEIQASRNIAPAFSTSKNYAIGDLVSREGEIYVFTTAHSKGAWNADHVSKTTMNEQANSSYIAKTSSYQTATAIVNAAQTYTDGQLTSYSTSTQTSEMISTYVTNNAYGKVSGIEITANGIEISGSKYIKIKSGGSFTVDSGKFSIDTSGVVTMTGGNIAGWSIGTKNIYHYVEDSSTLIRSNYVGMGIETYAFWAGGAGTTASTTPNKSACPFYVMNDGTVKATKGTIGGWYIGTNYIGDAGARDDSTVGMAKVSNATSKVFWAGGAFTGGSPTFYVTKGGSLYSTAGSVGGWTLSANRLSSGSGTGYVGLDSNTSNTYAIWAGHGTASSAPFRVKRDGTIYMTKMMMVKETSTGTTEEEVNFSSSDNRLRGATILGWTKDGNNNATAISTTYGTINFSKAVSSATWSWTGGMAKVDLTPQNQTFYSPALDGFTYVAGSTTYTKSSKQYSIRLQVYDTNGATALTDSMLFPGTDAYNHGVADANADYTHLGRRELGYMDHGQFESVGTHDWYYK